MIINIIEAPRENQKRPSQQIFVVDETREQSKPDFPQQSNDNIDVTSRNRKIFVFVLFFLQVILAILYCFFFKVKIHFEKLITAVNYPQYTDLIIMRLIGFGAGFAFIRSYCWGSLSYIFMTNALVIQLYFLFSRFFQLILGTAEVQWGDPIEITERQITLASYCVSAIIVTYAPVVGRISALEILIMAIISCAGYALNEQIIYFLVKIYDLGGTNPIHVYGGFAGVTSSFILGKKLFPQIALYNSHQSYLFSMFGTLAAWIYWPSTNAVLFPTTDYQRLIVTINTILVLCGSCAGAFAVSVLISGKFHMLHILTSTIAGGPIMGASIGLLNNFGVAIFMGLIAGILSSLGVEYISKYLQYRQWLYDTTRSFPFNCIIGILGGITSAFIIISYNSSPIQNQIIQNSLPFYKNLFGRTFLQQGGYQILGTLISIGMGILVGTILGAIYYFLNTYDNKMLFADKYEFEIVKEVDRANEEKILKKYKRKISYDMGQNRSAVQFSVLPPLKNTRKMAGNNNNFLHLPIRSRDQLAQSDNHSHIDGGSYVSFELSSTYNH